MRKYYEDVILDCRKRMRETMITAIRVFFTEHPDFKLDMLCCYHEHLLSFTPYFDEDNKRVWDCEVEIEYGESDGEVYVDTVDIERLDDEWLYVIWYEINGNWSNLE